MMVRLDDDLVVASQGRQVVDVHLGLFLVFLGQDLARLFLNTYTVPISFKLLKVVDLSDRATCSILHLHRNPDSLHGVGKAGRRFTCCFLWSFPPFFRELLI